MNEIDQLIIPALRKFTVEIDSASHSAYIRFKTGKIHKTLSDERQGAVIAIDLDSKNQIIGIELVGIRHINISAIKRILPNQLRTIDFERANFVSTAMHEQIQPVLAQ